MKVSTIWFKEALLIPDDSKLEDNTRQAFDELRKEILQLLQQQRFVSFVNHAHIYYDNQFNCLWLLYGFPSTPELMYSYVKKVKLYEFKDWDIPSITELESLRNETLFNHNEKFSDNAFYSSTPASEGGYQTVQLKIDAPIQASTARQMVLPIYRTKERDIFSFIITHSLVPSNVPFIEEKLKTLYQLSKRNNKNHPPLHAIRQYLLQSDYIRAHQPILEPSYLTDMEKGLWELYQTEKPEGAGWVEIDLDTPWEARNPVDDVHQGVVAIDFGTSSTVVACREQGNTHLLRVGMHDLFKKPSREDYENPTVLEFIHLPNLLAPWRSEAHRPTTRWEDIHFSHVALESFRKNHVDQSVVGSILTNLKQLPLYATDDRPLRIIDQTTLTELEINAIQYQDETDHITVSDDDSFDPIELYAYYLGLFINHRTNGIYLEYYMTFPVTYPKNIRERIRSAFSRGLRRSFPPTLLQDPIYKNFSITEEASEPAAYAACALSELDIEPSTEGTAYAVFDFGGGTTDFDFGMYRYPDDDEEMLGYEEVIEHVGASGDTYLGGENLIANIVYLSFLQNLEICREHRISFVCPNDAQRFPGDELFIDNSHMAQTNTALLMARLREVWEDFHWDISEDTFTNNLQNERPRRKSDIIADSLYQIIIDKEFNIDHSNISCEDQPIEMQLELLNRDQEKVEVTFDINRNYLNNFLVKRVGQGIWQFFIAMKQSFSSHAITPQEVHILLAGNASRSILVQALFATLLQDKMYGWRPDTEDARNQNNPILNELHNELPSCQFIVHRPPIGDINNPYAPTAKTGVAIGLLKLIPGETLLAVGPQEKIQNHDEAPFRYFIGRLRRGVFYPVILQNNPYHKWYELGIPTRGVFILYYSTSPKSTQNVLRRHSNELYEKSLRFPTDIQHKRLFIQALNPTRVEICLAESIEQINNRENELLFREEIDLSYLIH